RSSDLLRAGSAHKRASQTTETTKSARTRDRTWDLQFRKLSLYPTELCERDAGRVAEVPDLRKRRETARATRAGPRARPAGKVASAGAHASATSRLRRTGRGSDRREGAAGGPPEGICEVERRGEGDRERGPPGGPCAAQ